MTDPSSPVPAVEAIKLPGGYAMAPYHSTLARGTLYRLVKPDGESASAFLEAEARAFATAMSPTPGRAAEPDAMEEVEKLALDLVGLARANPPGSDDQPKAPETAALAALLSAVRTIVTERDYERARRIVLSSIAEKAHAHNAALRTRAETAEAQLATLQRRVKKLEKVLRPFAAEADTWANGVPDDYRSLCTEPGARHANPGSETIFTIGDLRRAALVLKGADR